MSDIATGQRVDRTVQRAAALELANKTRIRNAATKAEIAAVPTPDGYRRVADMLEDPDGPAGTIRVGQLVCAVYRVGPGIARPLLDQAGIYRAGKYVRDLTSRQRSVLARLLRIKALMYRPCPRRTRA